MSLPPLKFTPQLYPKIWGGNKLQKLLGKNLQGDPFVGESWEVSDNDGGLSVAVGGPCDGQSLRKIFKEREVELMGKQLGKYLRFPLLNKFIDASDNLSVQVHPGEKSLIGEPKTEAWYVVDAPPDSEIIVGVASTEPPEVILEKLKTSEATSVLNSIPVESGDVLFIPAGTVHAITKGLLIYEVQQNSDTTFRLYDWDRVDDQGVSRPLHLREAAEVIDYRVHNSHKILPLEISHSHAIIRYRVACPYFALVEYSSPQEQTVKLNEHFMILTCLTGKMEIKGDFGTIILELGETLLVPAIWKELCLIEMIKNSRIISSFVPMNGKEIFDPLVAAGHSEDKIRKLGGEFTSLW